ncbi:MAG: hypothetical protein QM784_33190 [Polyangiaceae bacterium]
MASSRYYSSGNLGSDARCIEVPFSLVSATCGGFASGRTFSVNGTAVTCTGSNLTLPAARNGGYCSVPPRDRTRGPGSRLGDGLSGAGTSPFPGTDRTVNVSSEARGIGRNHPFGASSRLHRDVGNTTVDASSNRGPRTRRSCFRG